MFSFKQLIDELQIASRITPLTNYVLKPFNVALILGYVGGRWGSFGSVVNDAVLGVLVYISMDYHGLLLPIKPDSHLLSLYNAAPVESPADTFYDLEQKGWEEAHKEAATDMGQQTGSDWDTDSCKNLPLPQDDWE